MPLLHQRTCQGRARQTGKTHDTEHHPHPDSRLLQIRRQAARRRRKQALDPRGKQPVNDGKARKPAARVNRRPAIQEQARAENERDQRVQGPKVPVCEVVGHDTPHGADAVHDQQVVDAVHLAQAKLVAPEAADVVEGEVDGPEGEEHADREQCIRGLAERGPFDQGAGFAGREPRFHEDEGQGLQGEHDEAEDADGPGEADLGEELPDDDGVDDAAGGGAAGCDADCEGALGGEVGGEDGEGRAEGEAVAEPGAEALGEEELPVARGEGGHEDAEDLEDGAQGVGGSEEAVVGGAAGEGADEEEEEDLRAADPGDVGGRVAKGGDVVGLEDAKGVDVAPGVGDEQVAHDRLRPSQQAAIWGWAWVFV